MKRLTILRHAKSSWDHSGLKDFERPLNDRGRKAARRIGKELRRRKMRFDLVIASPATRVRETLDEVATGYGDTFDVRSEPKIYMASVGALRSLVREIDDQVNAALLVGHNPGLEQLVVALSRDNRDGLRPRVEEKFPTGALAVIELDVERWSDVADRAGEIVELLFPRDLD